MRSSSNTLPHWKRSLLCHVYQLSRSKHNMLHVSLVCKTDSSWMGCSFLCILTDIIIKLPINNGGVVRQYNAISPLSVSKHVSQYFLYIVSRHRRCRRPVQQSSRPKTGTRCRRPHLRRSRYPNDGSEEGLSVLRSTLKRMLLLMSRRYCDVVTGEWLYRGRTSPITLLIS